MLKVYIDHLSQPCRAITAFLSMNSIKYDLIETRLGRGDTRSPEFLKINPLGKVPAIDDNGFILFESHSILRYLSRKYKVSENWYPQKNLEAAAIIDSYLDYHHLNLRFQAGRLVFNTLFAKTLGVEVPKEWNRESNKKMLYSVFDQMENVFLLQGKRAYIGGEHISIADLSAVCEIMQVLLLDDIDLTGFPVLKNWLLRVALKEDVKNSHEALFKIMRKKNPNMIPLFEQKAFL